MIRLAMQLVTDLAAGKPARKRSSRWPAFARAFLAGKTCAACGSRKSLNAHHKKPFHLYPELELDETNLLPLCEGPSNCHFVHGHSGDWRAFNEYVTEDARLMFERRLQRRYA